MSNSLGNCSICLSNNAILKVSATDINQVKWSSKLELCVPAVEWNDECCICPNCIGQLEIAYTFYRLCLQSYEVRKQQAPLVVKTEEPPLDPMEATNFNIGNSCLDENEIRSSSYRFLDDIEEVQIKNEKLEICDIENMASSSSFDLNEEDLNTEECYNYGEVISNMDEDNSDCAESQEMADGASGEALNLLPLKSRRIYFSAYNRFKQWCKQEKTEICTENALLDYFTEKAKHLKSSTLWAQYSMVKACLLGIDKIDVSKYPKLMAFLKKNSDGYRAKRSTILTKDQIEKFLLEANDHQYLMIKVVMIMGIAGACRGDELSNLSIDNIEDLGTTLVVRIPDTKTKTQRTFIVTCNEGSAVNPLDIYRKYIALRPLHTSHRRLFLYYKAGKCSTQVVGRNTFGKIPSQIAIYLNLPNPTSYTGHCFRRSSANNLCVQSYEVSKQQQFVVANPEEASLDSRDASNFMENNCLNESEIRNSTFRVLNKIEEIQMQNEKLENCDMENVASSSSFDLNEEVLKTEEYYNYGETVTHMDEDNSDGAEPQEIADANAAAFNLLPVKSKQIYVSAYSRFKEWCKQKKAEMYTEDVLLAYFTERGKEFKSSTLWAQFSMVKACLLGNDNIDISKYPKLMAFLKRNSDGYCAKRSKTLTRDQIEKFLLEANDHQYLMIKVVLILGIAGACSGDELTNLMIDNIQDLGSTLVVKVPDTKTKIQRTFIVTYNEGNVVNTLDIYRRYAALRPPHTTHRRLFINYRAGKCSTQVVGRNTFGKIPSQIAIYLKLPNPSCYTGHCLRRSSASLLRHAGVKMRRRGRN